MPAAPLRIAPLRLVGAPAAGRRALSVPVAARFAPDARTIPEQGRIDAQDPRWAFAVRVAARLQGGAAAILAPEDRAALLESARRLGLRTFDASLVIAIVQDSARSGLDPLGQAAEDGLSMVRPVQTEGGAGVGVLLACALGLGAAMMAAMVWWVVGR